MKLEVGMYYRYKGIIGKYYKPELGEPYFTNQYQYSWNKIANGGKFSHNIIDLIEVGDYVNGDLVLFAGATTWDNDGNVLAKQVHINHNGYDWWLREDLIKSIVTKEMYSSVEYRVETN